MDHHCYHVIKLLSMVQYGCNLCFHKLILTVTYSYYIVCTYIRSPSGLLLCQTFELGLLDNYTVIFIRVVCKIRQLYYISSGYLYLQKSIHKIIMNMRLKNKRSIITRVLKSEKYQKQRITRLIIKTRYLKQDILPHGNITIG